jgi:hypothetical protein
MVLSVRPGSEPTGRWTLLCAPELASSAAVIGKIGKIGAVAATPPARPVGGARAVSRQSGEQLLEGGVAAMSGDEALQAVLAQARAVAASDAHDRIGIARERLPVVWTTSMPSGFRLGCLQAQLDAPLADHHDLPLHQAEGGGVAALGSHARHLVEGVVQPLPFARDFLFAGDHYIEAFAPLHAVRSSIMFSFCS